ncbi:MAG: hypothetical protein ACKOBV_08955 [Candidatus Kapaibacterium sp.]
MTRNRTIKDHALWVLLPTLETDDPNLRYYYDFEPALAEYTRAFAALGLSWRWTSVRVHDIDRVLDGIAEESGSRPPCILNLCDGDETNGVPGISVVRALENRGWAYTGARERFYHVTTSKVDMKKAFDAHGVPTAPWCEVTGSTPPEDLFRICGSTVIIKPAVSGGSLGLSIRNVVQTPEEAERCVAELRAGYRGWDLGSGGIIAERFIDGREFTTFIVGSADGSGDGLHVYPPVERVFHESLPRTERFLSFDRLWETYDTESAMPGNDDVYRYAVPEASLHAAIEKVSREAYASVEGTGYGRLDIRMDAGTGALQVLEVNAQCGLSEDENYTSIGAILRFAGESFAVMTGRVLDDALRQHAAQRNSEGGVT